MKKSVLVSFLLIFVFSADLFAQDYMKMRKKQLRVEYQKKIDLINTLTKTQDSLSSSNIKLKSNLLEIFLSCCNEKLNNTQIEWHNKKSLCIVMCSNGYPDQFKKNILI